MLRRSAIIDLRADMARVKPLAELIEACIGPAYAAQGFASNDVVAAWPDLVGERLARHCQPVKLEWPRRRGAPDGRSEPGTLVVRVDGVFALELQHLVPVVIERVNAHYGWACIGRVVLKQGRVRRGGFRPAPPALDPGRRAAVTRAVAQVEADELRAALERLGVAVVATVSER